MRCDCLTTGLGNRGDGLKSSGSTSGGYAGWVQAARVGAGGQGVWPCSPRDGFGDARRIEQQAREAATLHRPRRTETAGGAAVAFERLRRALDISVALYRALKPLGTLGAVGIAFARVQHCTSPSACCRHPLRPEGGGGAGGLGMDTVREG